MKELKFPVEIFPNEKKVLQIKEGVYWVKLLLPSMISHVNAYILDDEDGISMDEFLQIFSDKLRSLNKPGLKFESFRDKIEE